MKRVKQFKKRNSHWIGKRFAGTSKELRRTEAFCVSPLAVDSPRQTRQPRHWSLLKPSTEPTTPADSCAKLEALQFVTFCDCRGLSASTPTATTNDRFLLDASTLSLNLNLDVPRLNRPYIRRASISRTLNYAVVAPLWYDSACISACS